MFPDDDDWIELEELDILGEQETEGRGYATRLGLGGPKMSKSIEDELSEFQNLNWTDVVNRKFFIVHFKK